MAMFSSLRIVCLVLAISTAESKSRVHRILAARSLSAAGLPDPKCHTGLLSTPTEGKPQVCCASYCGECSDYETCKSAKGQDSENACCATKVYEMRCGGGNATSAGAPANVCLKSCEDAVPPCIMPDGVYKAPDPATRHAGSDCDEVVESWRAKAASATTATAATAAAPAETLGALDEAPLK